MSNYDEYEGRPELLRKKERAEWWKRVGLVLVSAYLLGSMTLLSVNALTSFGTRHQIIDCTDPHGYCYQQAQARSDVAIQAVLNALNRAALQRDNDTRRIVKLAAFCADQPGPSTESEIRKCVRAHQQKEGQ